MSSKGIALLVAAAGALVFVVTAVIVHLRLDAVTRPAQSVAVAVTTQAPPPAASAQASAAAAHPPAPSFDIVRVGPTGTAVIAGRAAPGATVTVLDGQADIGRATANDRGEWVVLPDRPLASGSRELGLSATPAGGGPAQSGADIVVIAVPDTADTPPRTATGIAATTPASASAEPPSGSVAVVAIPKDGSGPGRVLQAPGDSGPPARGGARKLSLDLLDYDTAGQVRIGGSAPAGTEIRVLLDDTEVGQAKADTDGHWQVAPDRPVTAGHYRLRAEQAATAGSPGARVETPFQMADPARRAKAGKAIIVQPGANLWRIARTAYGQGTRYVVIFRANRDQIRDPARIFPGQVLDAPPLKKK